MSAIDNFVSWHVRGCPVKNGDGLCSCGRDKAAAELAALRGENDALGKMYRNSQDDYVALRAENEQLELEKGVLVGEINKLRAERQELDDLVTEYQCGMKEVELNKLRAELDEAKRLLRKHTSDNESSAFLARCSTAHPKEQE
jgi:predicted nuclease with TOPRIM domain